VDVLAENLRAATERRGLTAELLARRTGIRSADVTQYLTGQARPCPRHQAVLALALGTGVADLHREPEW